MSFLIRWLHLASVSLLLGGTLFLILVLYAAHRRGVDHRHLFDLMQVYEWVSWAAIGLVVMTGVGNLGHFGEALPGPESEWGRELTLKLALVGVFLAFSALRSIGVALHRLRPEPRVEVPPTLQGMYGATAVFVAGIMGVAIALAHF